MAHFRGIIRGQRGESTRLGTKNGGLIVEAQSWQGKVVVWLHEKDGRDYAQVTLEQHHGTGPARPVEVYDGPVGGMWAPAPKGGDV